MYRRCRGPRSRDLPANCAVDTIRGADRWKMGYGGRCKIRAGNVDDKFSSASETRVSTYRNRDEAPMEDRNREIKAHTTRGVSFFAREKRRRCHYLRIKRGRMIRVSLKLFSSTSLLSFLVCEKKNEGMGGRET